MAIKKEANEAHDAAAEDVPEGSLGAEGEVVTTVTHEGEEVEEKIVYDYDDDGNVVGSHKEVVK